MIQNISVQSGTTVTSTDYTFICGWIVHSCCEFCKCLFS